MSPLPTFRASGLSLQYLGAKAAMTSRPGPELSVCPTLQRHLARRHHSLSSSIQRRPPGAHCHIRKSSWSSSPKRSAADRLTGTPEQILAVAECYKAYYAKYPPSDASPYRLRCQSGMRLSIFWGVSVGPKPMSPPERDGPRPSNPARSTPRALLDHDLHFAAGFEPLARLEAVEHAEAFELAVCNRHAHGELLDGIARPDRDHLQAKRLGALDFRQAHAAEGTNRFAENAVRFGRAMLGGEDEAIDVAAEPDGIEPEIPLIAFRRRGSGRKAVDRDILQRALFDTLDPARG